MILNKTSTDTIAIWIPPLGFINSSFMKPLLPIILSTGVGIDNFINIDAAPVNVVQKICLNNAIYEQVRQVTVTGNFTFNPSSTALSALREITEYQRQAKRSIRGIGLIINPTALLVDTFKDMVWTNPYGASNRNKTLSDISMTFSSRPPTAISLGSLMAIPSIANILNGIL